VTVTSNKTTKFCQQNIQLIYLRDVFSKRFNWRAHTAVHESRYIFAACSEIKVLLCIHVHLSVMVRLGVSQRRTQEETVPGVHIVLLTSPLYLWGT